MNGQPAASCDEFLERHVKWLGPLGGAIRTLISAGSISPTRQDPSSTDVQADITISETPKPGIGGDGSKKFNVFPRDVAGNLAELGQRWDSFRKEAGLNDGQRATPRSWRIAIRNKHCSWVGAQLSLANLDGVAVENADFSKATFTGALIRHAKVSAKWNDAVLVGVDFSGTDFFLDNDFSGANLSGAKLTNTVISRRTSLRGADLTFADLTGAFFEPNDVAGVDVFGAKGLSDLKFQIPRAVLDLRKLTRERGLENEAKELTASVFKGRLTTSPFYVRLFANWVQGGRLTNYGLKPWNAVIALLALIPCFAVFYGVALSTGGPSGIWVIHYVDGPLEKNQRSVRLNRASLGVRSARPKVRALERLLKIVRVAFYFSLSSAFQIGYRELNLGNWISRLQSRPYTLKATGWVRTTVGLQSLTSLYLLALWAITFFSNPFDS